jgi:hypothetical protein
MKPGYKQTEVEGKIHQAMRCLINNDRHLLSVDANERSLTHRLAVYLEQVFPDYHVDCEYNRDREFTKRLESFQETVPSDVIKGATVYPDIIVHHRGTDINFIVIEAKKYSVSLKRSCSSETSGSQGCSCDRCKLRAYKKDMNYSFAFFVTFPVSELTSSSLTELIEEIQ